MKTFLKLLLVLVTFSKPSQAQNISCPPNIDFEFGNLNNWQFFTGSCCPINANTITPALVNRHTLTSGTGLDPYGQFPVVSPGGGSYSFKLGNNSTGAQAERARYTFTVPSGFNNYSLIYKYAVVFQDPGHTPAQQPRFVVRVFDSATNQVLPCADFTYIAASNLPGFQTSNLGTNVRYKSWSTASIDLSGYGGQTLVAEFSSGDCSLSGHFGYGYVDLSCGLFEILSVNCNNDPLTTLNAPPGFAQYLWYDSTYSNQIGTGQTITINTPAQNTLYNLIIVPYVGFGCPDTLQTVVTISNFNLFLSNDTTICQSDTIQLNASVVGNTNSYNYSWLPNNNISCLNCSGPTVAPTSSITYTVVASDVYGCSKSDTITVDVIPTSSSIINQSICEPDSFLGYSISGTYIDTFVNSNGCDSIRTLNLIVNPITFSTINQTICESDTFLGYYLSGTYVDTFSNSNGCDSIRTINLTINPITYNIINQTICEPDSYLGYSSTGTYVDTLNNSNGCDSIRTLNLIVNPITYSLINQTICEPDTFLGYNTTGIFKDTLINQYGCDSIRTLDLLVHPILISNFKDSICYGQSYLGYSQTGLFIDTFISQYGCDSLRLIDLYVDEIKVDIDLNDIYCVEESNGKIIVKAFNGIGTYKYSLKPGLHINTSGLFNDLHQGTYTLTIQDSYGCKKDTLLSIGTIDEILMLNIDKSDLPCYGSAFDGWAQANPTGGKPPYTYLWFTEPIQTNKKIENLSFGHYSVKVIDANGCEITDTVYIEPSNCCDVIFIPNAFSPNGDGLNDIFRVTTTAGIELFQWAIYNRWGNKVWSSNDYLQGWDGKIGGKEQSIGTYFYIFNYKCISSGEEFLLKGDLILLR